MLSAEELHRRGLALSNAGRYTSARRQFTLALSRATLPDTVARVTLSLAYVEAELGSTDAGLARCAEALAVAGIGQQVRGLVHSQIALLQMRAGSGEQALASFATAIGLLDDSPEARARALLNRGLVYLQRRDAVRAEQDARAAGELYREAGDPTEAAKADHNRGYARLLVGDLVSALKLMERAAPLLEPLSATYEAVVLQDRAEVLVAAGMLAEAEAALGRAARAYGSRGLRLRQADVELILARTVALRDPARAAKVARRAEARFRKRGNEHWERRARAVELAARVAAGRAPADATSRADALAVELTRARLPHEAIAMRTTAVRAALSLGDVDDAGQRLARLRPGASAPLGLRLETRELRAELAGRRGQRARALTHVRAGLDDLHTWQATFGSLDLLSTVVGHGRRLAVTGARLAVDDGRPDVVFEWIERARALSTRVTPMRPPADPAAAAALAALRAAPDAETEAMLRREIRQHAWYGAGSEDVQEPVRLDQVRDELTDAEAALVSYLALDGVLWAVVVSGHGTRLVRMPGLDESVGLLAGLRSDLDMSAADLPAAFHESVATALRARLQRLDELLIGPLPGLEQAQRVAVVPSGALAGTPWALLPSLRERGVTVPGSASWWARHRRVDAPRRVGVVAGPGVARAADEVRSVAASWADATTLIGRAATAEAVTRLAERVDLLHVAAHGRHSGENALFSGLELDDGPWFGYDIDQLGAVPGHVVLSACELGRSSVRWGEETIGMTVAWLHAGAVCVLAAPASVADQVACDLLTGTHRRLAEGAPAAEALADARREVPDGDLAAFTCHGAAW